VNLADQPAGLVDHAEGLRAGEIRCRKLAGPVTDPTRVAYAAPSRQGALGRRRDDLCPLGHRA